MPSVFRITASVPLPDETQGRIRALRLAADAAEALAPRLPEGAAVETKMTSPRGPRSARAAEG